MPQHRLHICPSRGWLFGNASQVWPWPHPVSGWALSHTTHPPQRDGIPQALGARGTCPRHSNSLQTLAMQWFFQSPSTGQAFYKTTRAQAQPARDTSHAGSHMQGCTCDLLLSQTQNEGKGHRDVQIRSNEEFPSAFTQSLQNVPLSMPPSLPGRNHPSSGCLCPGLGQSISQQGKGDILVTT